jgi:hypothetical protein
MLNQFNQLYRCIKTPITAKRKIHHHNAIHEKRKSQCQSPEREKKMKKC